MLIALLPCNLSEFLDSILNEKQGKMFIFKTKSDATSIKKLKKINEKLRRAIIEIRSRNLKGTICRPSCALYEALVYKFGVSNKHQKFWRNTLQIYRILKKLNKQDIIGSFVKFSKRLEESKFLYLPTKKAVRFLGALLLRRILFLDKLRLYCAKSADCSMGYIELRHFLTFNLMSIAIASDVASEALRQMQQLAIVYAELGDWFRRSSKHFPASAKMIKFKTIIDEELRRDGRNEYKYLKQHDLALLKREIEEISNHPMGLEQSNLSLKNLPSEHLKEKNLLRMRKMR